MITSRYDYRHQFQRENGVLKEKLDLAVNEKQKAEAGFKSAQVETKRLAASKQAVEKQFIFDLKKAEKKSSIPRPIVSGLNVKLEQRLNGKAEKMIRAMQEENRELRGEVKSLRRDESVTTVSKKEAVSQQQSIADPNHQQVVKMRIEIEMLKEGLKIELQKNDMMARYLDCNDENNPSVITQSNQVDEVPERDELFEFFQVLSPIKK